MPVFRYFIFVGGALLALLFAADFVWPASPVAIVTAGNDQPMIRIRSDRHLPERVVLDTSQPAIVAPAVKTATVAAPQQPAQEGVPPALAEMSAKARVRETFAQFTPTPKADAASLRKPDARPLAQAQVPQGPVPQAQVPQGPVPQAQPRRKVARAHPAPQFGPQFAPQFGRPMMVAQQPHYGLFNNTW
jgi:hypothetical protein